MRRDDMQPADALKLTQDLIRCASVTPEDAGAIGVVAGFLEAAGFSTIRVPRGGIENLIALWRAAEPGPVLGFNGHTDVVPVGGAAAWKHPPFGAEIHGGVLYGRGAVDMKSGVAAFCAAAVDFIRQSPPEAGGFLITITGDEEGEALDGTKALLDEMRLRQLRMDHCIVGEPTCPDEMGEMIKIGRRGSLTLSLLAKGVQGHAAYPHRAKNPLPPLAKLIDQLSSTPMDTGSAHFDPSTLAVTTIDTGNTANNVIPAEARATINIRFNDLWTADAVRDWVMSFADEISAASGVTISAKMSVSGESFLTPPGAFQEMISDAVAHVTGRRPELSTSGGTSDARFIKDHCPVVECGLVGRGMHGVDECVPVAQIAALKAIYSDLMRRYFSNSRSL